MTAAQLLSSIEFSCRYLKKLQLFCDSTHKIKELSPSKYSDEYYQTFHDNDYNKTFVIASQNRDYDILLKDGSFFQFTARSETDIHYSFFPCIEETLSFDQYFEEYATEDNVDNLEQEYEMYLSTDRERNFPCPIRYDLAVSEYTEVLHPYAHIHVGINTDIRIACDKVLKPEAFVDWVIKNMYKNEWDTLYQSDDRIKQYVLKLKEQGERLSSDKFTSNERKVIHIT